MKWLTDHAVYTQQSDHDILFYDTRTGKYAVYIFQGEGCDIKNNIITWKEQTEQLENLIYFLEYHGMGRKITPEHPAIQLMNSFEMLTEQFQAELDNKYQPLLKDMLVELTLCINSPSNNLTDQWNYFYPFSNAIKEKIIPEDIILDIFRKNHFQNLKKIVLTGHQLWQCHVFEKLYNFLKEQYPIEICVAAEDYLHPEFRKSKKAKITSGLRIVCAPISLEELQDQISKQPEVALDIYVKNMSQLEKATEFIAAHPKNQINIVPYFSQNTAFLKKVLSYTPLEILKSRHTKMSIIRNSLVNEFMYGRLIIQNNGEVYAGTPQVSCGNLNQENFGTILLNASQDTQSWKYVRSKFDPCRNCSLSCLCPPLTTIEILSGKTFCRKKHNKK